MDFFLQVAIFAVAYLILAGCSFGIEYKLMLDCLDADTPEDATDEELTEYDKAVTGQMGLAFTLSLVWPVFIWFAIPWLLVERARARKAAATD